MTSTRIGIGTMSRVIADSSVWIDHFGDKRSPEVEALRGLIGSGALILADLVAMEVLRGVSDDIRHAQMRRALQALPMRTIASRRVVLRAGDNYRFLRKRGYTIRSAVDCLIATFCIENGFELLHSDRDYLPFEEHLGLKSVAV